MSAWRKKWDRLSESRKAWVRHRANWEQRSIGAIVTEYEVPSSYECRQMLKTNNATDGLGDEEESK